ncbi:uncharacterized protein LOC122575315 isoform X2 [Bombus pyrosoma]|uniref:uncharacterized protein LOC122575315 isoform X2 n=1 Tax=Bombus pyrosoma TaxID=396416 RepID=UPI001CB92ABD|nr:uncharacterized protein LOC122575315 isoform X2 [Bombus pyrosoma]
MGRRKHRSKGSKLPPLRSSKCNVACEKSTTCDEAKAKEERERRGTTEKTITPDVMRYQKERTECFHQTNDPIGVRSRLMYPLVQPSLFLINSSILSEENESVEDECIELKGLSQHRDLCEALTEIYSSIVLTLSDGSGVQLDADQYRIYRLKLLAILESEVKRSLDLWEKEIILYPRVCRVCRRFSEKLICCAHCGMEFFCEEHGDEHKNWCEEFRVYQRILQLQQKHGYVNPKIPNAHLEMFVAQPEFHFDELMHRIYGSSLYYRQMDCYTYALLSHLCTIPLTALYSMQISCPEWRNRTEWTIHILGAEFQFEGIHLDVWEKLFLHFLPNLQKLHLILIGPELQLPKDVPPRLLSMVPICKKCKSAGRAVIVTFKPEKLYHCLVRDPSQTLATPDLICLFNPGLYRTTGFAGKDTWLETIREFSKTLAPTTITSYTAQEMLWEINRINSVADVEVLLQPCKNPFASVKPDRNFVSDNTNPLIYKNYYITIVKGKSIVL